MEKYNLQYNNTIRLDKDSLVLSNNSIAKSVCKFGVCFANALH